MQFKLLFLIGLVFLSAGIIEPVFGQISIGGKANQKSIDVIIEDFDKIHVIHKIAASKSAVSVTLLEGDTSNIQVIDKDGNEIEPGVSGGFGGTVITIFPTNEDVFIEYDLSGVMFKKHQVTWTWSFLYLHTTTFHIPDSVDLIFVNDRPVLFTDAKKFNCHGCEMVLEFIPNEKKTVQKVIWEDEEFDVEIWASTELNSFNFNQPAKSISYDFDDTERWVTLIIPLELLWKPYQSWMGDEKIFTHEFKVDDERYGVSLKLTEPGTVSIVGTSVIPEFPIILPLMIIGITMVIVLQYRNKFILR